MSRTMLAALTLLAVAACGRGDKRDVASADSLSRDLQLAPVDTSAALNDRPSAPIRPRRRPRRRRRPRPRRRRSRSRSRKPAPNAGARRRRRRPSRLPRPAARGPAALPPAPRFAVATDAEIRSHKNKVGDEVTATVGDRREGRRGPGGHSGGLQGHAPGHRHQGVGEQERHHRHADAQADRRLDQRQVAADLRLDLGREDRAAGPRDQRGRHRQGRRRARRPAPSWAG